MQGGEFQAREQLVAYEWREGERNWTRPPIEKSVMAELTARDTPSGVLRMLFFVALLGGSAALFVVSLRWSVWLALLPLYAYFFVYGFWVAIGHELQHKTVFARRFDGLSEAVFYGVQALMWNSPTYARKSHQLHHRYTMVRGMDPETAWPEVFTSRWLRGVLRDTILRILIVGAFWTLAKDVAMQLRRIGGRKDRMMAEQCSEAECAAIRRESLGILLFHVSTAAAAVALGCWEWLVLVTIAWQVGSAFEGLWHNTEHIGRLYNVNDQRLCTRSIRVGPLVRLLYWGLDDHVDHHLFPAVPSCHLPRLHALLRDGLPEPQGLIACWREMFAVAREKDGAPQSEFVPSNALGEMGPAASA